MLNPDPTDCDCVVCNSTVRRLRGEVARLTERIAEYEHQINWHTTCENCARVLDASYAETMRAETAEAEVARLQSERDEHAKIEDRSRPVSASEAVEAEHRQDQPGAVRIGNSDQCQHESKSGDEGPIRDLPGGLATVVRWRCDGCGAISYDDTGLAALRAEVTAAKADALEQAAKAVGAELGTIAGHVNVGVIASQWLYERAADTRAELGDS